MRINYLSEIPSLWEQSVLKWSAINKKFKKQKHGVEIPDSNDEYFFYQTLTGSWPIRSYDYTDYKKRVREYMLKAVREAKIHTAWIEYDKEDEQGILSFVDSAIDEKLNVEFLIHLYLL
jgi:(1->4)-alpha-D-glucan 1-alpha-D-glucosylmutase